MKKLLYLLLLVLPLVLFAEPTILGKWITEPANTFVEFRDDGKYQGSFFAKRQQKNVGKYTLLKDRSGIVVYSYSQAAIYDIRELTEDRMILAYGGIAFIFNRATEKRIEIYKKELAEEERKKRYTNNLRQVASAGQQYILEEGVKSVTYSELVGTFFREIEPIDGEDYTSLEIFKGGGTLRIKTNSGEVFEYRY